MKKQNGWSLVEMITITAVMAMMFSLSAAFFADGWTIARRTVAESNSGRLVGMIIRQWPETLTQSEPALWRIEGNTFIAGQESVTRGDDVLIFRNGTTEHPIHLDNSTMCRFSIERNAAGSRLAVMTLTMRSREFSRRVHTNSLRLVACGKDNG